jgi:hypothetical protein
MLTPILCIQLLPVQGGRGCWGGGRLGQGSRGIDVEIAIVRVLLAEVVAWVRLGADVRRESPAVAEQAPASPGG